MNHFLKRIEVIEYTIKKYGYDIFLQPDKSQKTVFKIDIENEWLPTIYDLYALSYFKTSDTVLKKRIIAIVNYILDDRFQSIPSKAYIYDKYKKRTYAAGRVYHACFRQERMLLMLLMLSNVEGIKDNEMFMAKLEYMETFKRPDGYYELDRSMVKESKHVNYIYTGAHMGLGENRRSKGWCQGG